MHRIFSQTCVWTVRSNFLRTPHCDTENCIGYKVKENEIYHVPSLDRLDRLRAPVSFPEVSDESWSEVISQQASKEVPYYSLRGLLFLHKRAFVLALAYAAVSQTQALRRSKCRSRSTDFVAYHSALHVIPSVAIGALHTTHNIT